MVQQRNSDLERKYNVTNTKEILTTSVDLTKNWNMDVMKLLAKLRSQFKGPLFSNSNKILDHPIQTCNLCNHNVLRDFKHIVFDCPVFHIARLKDFTFLEDKNYNINVFI